MYVVARYIKGRAVLSCTSIHLYLTCTNKFICHLQRWTVQVWVICASDTVRATGELHIVYE